MLRIGLTGGIASGKSTVARFFADLGVPVIDTDLIAHELTAAGSEVLQEIRHAFGAGALNDDGSLNRRQLRNLIFADPDQRRKLEGILHPRIRAEALSRADAADAPYVLLVVPLLFESGFDQLVDRKLVVDCPESVQVRRLMERDACSEAEARAALDAQMPRADRLAAADDIIDNAASLDTVRARVSELDEQYNRLARNCSSGSSHAE